MKLCKDCKHYVYRNSGLFDWCTHPRFGVNPVDGVPNTEFPGIQRAEPYSPYEEAGARCGPEGLYFEQKDPETVQVKKSWLKTLVEKWKRVQNA